MDNFFNTEYDNFGVCEYRFVDIVLKDIFGKRQVIRRYSLGGDGIFNLLYLDNLIYEFRIKQVKSIPISDNKKAYRDTTKDMIIEKIANKLTDNKVKFAITEGKIITLQAKDYILQVEIIKKVREPENLGKTRIDGEWI